MDEFMNELNVQREEEQVRQYEKSCIRGKNKISW